MMYDGRGLFTTGSNFQFLLHFNRFLSEIFLKHNLCYGSVTFAVEFLINYR